MLQWTSGCMHLSELVFSFPSDVYPEVKSLDHMEVLFLIFWGTSILFFKIPAQFTFLPTVCKCSLFSKFLPTFAIFCLFNNSHLKRYEVISLWFLLAFPGWLVMLNIFSCCCWPPVCIVWKNAYSAPLPIFNQDAYFFFVSCLSF